MLFLYPLAAQHPAQHRDRIVVYNVENLFDTVDDPHTDDKDFLPHGAVQWDEGKYFDKLSHLSRVLSDIGQWQYPALIGLCEVENTRVLTDLLRRPALRQAPYHFAISEGSDPRGIDVALIWDHQRFRPLRLREIPAYPPTDGRLWIDYHEGSSRQQGRHALWATLRHLATGQILEVILVHAPSRRYGTRATAPRRHRVMAQLRQVLDAIHAETPDRAILLMGDFNDNPSDTSIAQTLQALPISTKEPIKTHRLYTLAPETTPREGTHHHQRRGWVPDQIMATSHLLQTDSLSLRIAHEAFRIFAPPYLRDKDGKPRRSFKGTTYVGGYSDHFPVFLDIIY